MGSRSYTGLRVGRPRLVLTVSPVLLLPHIARQDVVRCLRENVKCRLNQHSLRLLVHVH